MKKVAVMLADGFEEIEAISVLDVLKRAGINTLGVSLDDSKMVRGAHEILIQSDIAFSEFRSENFDAIILPGGLPGASNLANNERLLKILREFDADGKLLGAICAAPMALGAACVLKDKFTCYPGFEKQVNHGDASYTDASNVVTSGNIITSSGPATAMEFALFCVKELAGEAKFNELKQDLLFK